MSRYTVAIRDARQVLRRALRARRQRELARLLLLIEERCRELDAAARRAVAEG